MMRHFWRKYHKWVGLVFTFFILMFCFSGIILNHRPTFADAEISRKWMPSDYHYVNWNNGIVRGTFPTSDNKVLVFGNAGVWKTDSCFSVFAPLSHGMRLGVDHRKISNVVKTSDGSIWCAGLYDIYRLSDKEEWTNWTACLKAGEERISDIYARGDTLVVLSRSLVYESLPPYQEFNCYELKAPQNYEPKVSLFRTVWMLHSGELFGTVGKLGVDLVALVIVVLCFTGLIYLFIPKTLRYRAKRKLTVEKEVRLLRFSVKWHNKLGAWTLFFTLMLAVTGMCLRPPLMIPLVMTSVSPIPGSALDVDNPWHDKMRGIRWDEARQEWLLSTSSGFYGVKDFKSVPHGFEISAPVSPMGINVFEKNETGEWLIGSFSGLFRWDIETGQVCDYFTDEPYRQRFGPPIAKTAVSGFSTDLLHGEAIVFDFIRGICNKGGKQIHVSDMPEEIADQPMSLWNFALELHVGRCYSPFLGPFSSLFVFLSGLLLTFILISGYILHRKPKRKK